MVDSPPVAGQVPGPDLSKFGHKDDPNGDYAKVRAARTYAHLRQDAVSTPYDIPGNFVQVFTGKGADYSNQMAWHDSLTEEEQTQIGVDLAYRRLATTKAAFGNHGNWWGMYCDGGDTALAGFSKKEQDRFSQSESWFTRSRTNQRLTFGTLGAAGYGTYKYLRGTYAVGEGMSFSRAFGAGRTLEPLAENAGRMARFGRGAANVGRFARVGLRFGGPALAGADLGMRAGGAIADAIGVKPENKKWWQIGGAILGAVAAVAICVVCPVAAPLIIGASLAFLAVDVVTTANAALRRGNTAGQIHDNGTGEHESTEGLKGTDYESHLGRQLVYKGAEYSQELHDAAEKIGNEKGTNSDDYKRALKQAQIHQMLVGNIEVDYAAAAESGGDYVYLKDDKSGRFKLTKDEYKQLQWTTKTAKIEKPNSIKKALEVSKNNNAEDAKEKSRKKQDVSKSMFGDLSSVTRTIDDLKKELSDTKDADAQEIYRAQIAEKENLKKKREEAGKDYTDGIKLDPKTNLYPDGSKPPEDDIKLNIKINGGKQQISPPAKGTPVIVFAKPKVPDLKDTTVVAAKAPVKQTVTLLDPTTFVAFRAADPEDTVPVHHQVSAWAPTYDIDGRTKAATKKDSKRLQPQPTLV